MTTTTDTAQLRGIEQAFAEWLEEDRLEGSFAQRVNGQEPTTLDISGEPDITVALGQMIDVAAKYAALGAFPGTLADLAVALIPDRHLRDFLAFYVGRDIAATMREQGADGPF
jgi:hypothetical protein